jgi:hypothetical protein
MDDRLQPLLGVLVLLGLFILFGVLVVWRRRKRKESAADLEREEHVQEGIDRGELIRDRVTGEVYPTCVICGGRATEFAPTCGTSWMDRLPLLNYLYSLSPRYVLEDDHASGYQLCRIHKQLSLKEMERFHAVLRAERAQFNAAQEVKVAQLLGGGLKKLLMEQHQAALQTILVEVDSTPRLPASKDSAPLTIVSSSSSTAKDGENVA